MSNQVYQKFQEYLRVRKQIMIIHFGKQLEDSNNQANDEGKIHLFSQHVASVF